SNQRARAVGRGRRAEPGDNPRMSYGTLLPLHRLSGDCRCDRGRGAGAPVKLPPDQPSRLTPLDRPNSYIGRSVPRPNLARLTQGRGQYVSDVVLPRMAHVAFVRSPHAHARVKRVATKQAKKAPGAIAVVTGAELADVITPWVGVLTHLKGIKSAPQHAIAIT